MQNFLPKPGTAMRDHPPCPPEDHVRAIALARLVLPADVHVQAPPNLSDPDRLGDLLDAGIDDWGGVSPVTIDHVNPERPWPAAATRCAPATEAPRPRAGAAADGLPRVRRSSPTAGWTRRPGSRCWTAPTREGLGSRRPGRDLARAAPGRRQRRHRRRGRPDRPPLHRLVLRRRHPPAPLLTRFVCDRRGDPRDRRRIGRRRGRRGAGRASGPGRRSARRRSSPCSGPAGRRSPRSPRWPTTCAAQAGRRRGHLRGQPQHQLHQRVHVPVHVLRVLQGPAVAEPAGRAVPAVPRRHRRARRRGGATAARPRCACRAASTRPSTATSTSTWSARCKQAVPGMHVHGFTALEVTEGAKRLGEPLAAYLHPAQGRRPRLPARHRRGDPRRRGPRRALPGQGEHRGVARGAPGRPRGRAALQHHHHVRLRRAPGALGPAPAPHPRPAEGDRRVHRVRAAAVRAHGRADLPQARRPPRTDLARERADARRRPDRLRRASSTTSRPPGSSSARTAPGSCWRPASTTWAAP